MTSYELRHHFPWLGTEEPVSGADVIDALNKLYAERVADEADPVTVAYRAQAREEYHREGEVEIDDNAVVSVSDDGGAYVSAWVWVYDEEDETEDDCDASEDLEQSNSN
jgi:hypothetical protein